MKKILKNKNQVIYFLVTALVILLTSGVYTLRRKPAYLTAVLYTSTTTQVTVNENTPGTFTIKLAEPQNTDIKLDWWIVN